MQIWEGGLKFTFLLAFCYQKLVTPIALYFRKRKKLNGSNFAPNRAKLLNGGSSCSGTYQGISPAGLGVVPEAKPIIAPGIIRSIFCL